MLRKTICLLLTKKTKNKGAGNAFKNISLNKNWVLWNSPGVDPTKLFFPETDIFSVFFDIASLFCCDTNTQT